jgi:class 3 adenylate cyclase
VAELPSGTVTFLISDVVGATRLLDRHGDAAVTALDRHENLVREVVQAHAGAVFTGGGDNFGSVFDNPLDAVEAAIDLQRRQRLEHVDEVGPLSVRMAIHSGVAQPYHGDYRSPNTYRAFRLAALARGGQVLISHSTQELLGGAVAPGVSLRALGEYRLRDLAQLEHVFQLVAPDLPDFSVLDRVLLAILFTDIVGSTATAVRLGDRSWRMLLATHHAVLREYLPQFRGREIRSTGDGICAVFNTPTQAIECALAMCDAVRTLEMEIRAGIHTGECELVDDVIEGLAVHIAARVCACAEAGEVLVSRPVTELVAGSGITFVDRATHLFKGVPGEWQLLRVAKPE